MRVLLTTDTIGGVWTFTQELASELLRRGHQVALVSFGRLPSTAQQEEMDALFSPYNSGRSGWGVSGYHPSAAPLEWMDANDRAWSEGVRSLEQVIRSFDPEIIHSSQLCFGMLGGGRPVLVTAHSDVLSWAESTLPEGIGGLEQTSDPAWLSRYRKLASEGLAWAESLVAPTVWMTQTLLRLYGLDRKPAVIPNGRTLAACKPSTSAVQPRQLQAVTAGRLWDQAKGLEVLHGCAVPFPILLAGEASFEHNNPAQPSILTPLGSLPQPELHALFHRSAIYLGASVYEPFGLAPLEAALCGCALVLRDIPTFRELWADAALFFHDAQTLETHLHALAADPALLQNAQRLSQGHARRYSAANTANLYLAEYERLVQKFGIVLGGMARSEDHA